MNCLESLVARFGELEDCAPPVVVGVSGGPDSLALLAFAAAVGRLPVAVHVDHGLRRGSTAEADLVASAAARIDVPCRSVRVHVPPGGNLEARARAARYDALEAARRASGASAVLVGHTMDDQAETVVLNLVRGSASAGLGAMAARSGTVVRPFLRVRRFETEAVCAELGLEPLTDSMNADAAFRRVWIRTEVLPRLAEGAQRDLVPVLARQADVLRSESALLDELASASWPGAEARARALAAIDPVLARRAVRCWVGPPPPRYAEVDAILSVARGERRAVDLAGGRRVWRTGGRMHCDLMRRGSTHAAPLPAGSDAKVADYGVGA